MKGTPGPLLAHYQLPVTTLAMLYLVRRKDGVVYGFTDHDVNIVYAGTTYKADTGFAASATASNDSLAVDNLEIQSVLNSDQIQKADIDAGLWDGAYVTQYRCNWANIGQGVDYMQTGQLGNVQTGVIDVINEIRGLSQNMAWNIVRLIGPLCQHSFCDANGIQYGAGCTLSPAAWTVTGTIGNLSSDGMVVSDAARTEAANYFAGGIVTWTSGLNNGVKMEVKSNVSGQFSLYLPMPFQLVLGDTYSLLAGCDKSASTCQARSNHLNHGGFEDLPGNNRVLLAADRPTPGGGGKF